MRILTASLAALLSVLIVSTSVSASACDLSCWLRQAHSDCHSAASASPGNSATPEGMDMSMDMGSGDSKSMTAMTAIQSGHSMLMFPEMGMATQGFEQASKAETNRSGMPDHSKSISSCAHETCSQTWSATSPPTGDHSHFIALYQAAIGILIPVNLHVASYSIGVGAHPPGILAPDSLVTALRI